MGVSMVESNLGLCQATLGKTEFAETGFGLCRPDAPLKIAYVFVQLIVGDERALARALWVPEAQARQNWEESVQSPSLRATQESSGQTPLARTLASP